MSEDVLIVDIDALINAYNEGLTRNISASITDTNVDIGLHQPLVSMEMMLESNLFAADLSFARYAMDLATESSAVIEEVASTEEEAVKIKDYLYRECYTTDIEGNRTEELDFFTNDSLTEYSWKDGVALKKKRYTNDFNARLGFNLTRYYDDKIVGKDGTIKWGKYDLNFGIEKCFDCVIDINLEQIVPALEFTFDFSKQLQKIKELLNQLEQDLNPTAIFKMLCEVALNFGGNLICPSNLAAIELLLPVLFTKYSVDLLKLRLDWTVILGPIIKTAISALISYVENIPKLIVPFLDCVMNALRATVRYISNILKSAENVYNTLGGSIDKAVGAIHSAITSTKEGLQSIGILDSDLEDIEEDLEDLDKELKDSFNKNLQLALKKQAIDTQEKELLDAVNKFVYYLNVKYTTLNVNLLTLSLEEIKVDLIDFLVDFPKYIDVILGSYSEEDLNTFKEIQKEKARLDRLSKERASLEESYDKELTASKNRKKYFRLDFVADNRELGYFTAKGYNETYNKVLKEKIDEFKKLNPNASRSLLESKTEIFEREARAEAKKIAFPNTAPEAKKTKDKRDLAWGINSKNENYKRKKEDTWNWKDYVFAKYGVDIESQYRETKYNLLPKANFAKSASEGIKGFVDDYFIKYLQEAKDYVMKVTANIILAFKSLESFLGEYVETDIKILGNIQEILHLIRFSRILYEILKNGFSSCKDIKENKAVFENILTQTNQNLLLDDSILESENLDPEDHIAIKSKDGRYSTIIDLNNCDEAMQHLSVNENNLDSIYEGILDGIYR